MRWIDGLDQMLTLGSRGQPGPMVDSDYRRVTVGNRELDPNAAVPMWLDGEKIEEA